jgi:release factor glutamine methyltransferase
VRRAAPDPPSAIRYPLSAIRYPLSALSIAMPTTVAALLNEGVARIGRTADQPRVEAGILLGAALGKSRAWLLAHQDEQILDCEATDIYEAHVTRRAHGEPIAYILGEKEFWSLPLAVTPAVLIPRPETELAVELALALLPAAAQPRVLDLGTGSGAIALALAQERPRARVVGTDIAAGAVELARHNAARLGLVNVEFRAGSWFEPVAGERFDLLVSNPPYIAADDPRVEREVRLFEPPGALYAGTDGLEALRLIIAGAAAHLVPGGGLVLEHGDRQGEGVRHLLDQHVFERVTTHRDLAGCDRCTIGHRPGGAP